MKTKILLFSLLLACGTVWTQTSYGNLQQGNAGDVGGISNSFFGYQSGVDNGTGPILPTEGISNTFIGYRSGYENNFGSDNTFLGSSSGYNNTSGFRNTFIGVSTGRNNTNGDFNTYLGWQSGYNNQTGLRNVFLGYAAGFNETGSDRLYIDNSSTATPLIFGNFSTNRVGINHNNPSYTLHVGGTMGATTFHGSGSGLTSLNASNISTGTVNNLRLDADLRDLADGSLSASRVQYGTYFITSPGSSGQVWQSDGSGRGVWTTINTDDADADPNNEIQTLSYDTALHNLSISDGNNVNIAPFPSYPASAGDLGGNTNSYFGHLSGENATGTNNTFVGYQSGSDPNNTGIDNSSLGSQTLGRNTTGERNTANGVYTLNHNTTGNGNTAVGYAAIGNNSAGSYNTAIGHLALLGSFSPALNTGNSNAVIGHEAMFSNQNGTGNTAVGRDALRSNIEGDNNVALGRDALTVNVSGDENIAIGFNSGATAGNTGLNTTIAIGSSASVGADDAIAIGNVASAAHTNSIAIGNNATTTVDNQLMIGNAFITDITAVAEIQTMSDGRFKKGIEEDVPGLEFIEKLRPVSYELDRNKLHTFLTGEGPKEMNNNSSDARHNGFIAQEVAEIAERDDYAFWGVKEPANENDTYAIRYAQFVVPLVKAVQELSMENKELRQEMETLKNMVYDTEATDPSTPTDGLKEEATISKGFSLAQNTPNPFNETTIISATVPDAVRQAKIAIYNLNGLELHSYDLNKRGTVSVEISGGILPSGMYLYALLADGRIIATKKMILKK